jgi:AmmeMemoRadiSam system protein B
MVGVRAAAVAGMFYPGAPAALSASVRACLAAADVRSSPGESLKALIVPHAGYVYSGPVAAAGYARLAASGGSIRRVVILGPAHRMAVRGLALPSVRAFATPLGEIDIDREAASLALLLPQVRESDAAHAQEHSIEVQLPFLQAVLADFRIVPFVVGAATDDEVADVIDRLWGGPETLIVVSSDLSHYHGYAEARAIDRDSANDILSLSSALDHDQACGATPVNALLHCARRRGLAPELLDLRNSGDTAGDKSRVVGYASFAFVEASVRGRS